MSLSFLHSFRFALSAAAAIGAVAAFTFACTSAGGGNLGDSCQSESDCQNQYECLAVDDAGMCNAKALTCQQACTGPGDCVIVGANFNCTPMDCAGPGNSGICTSSP